MNFKTYVLPSPGRVYILHTSVNLHELFCSFNLSEIVLLCLISMLKHSIAANCSRTNGCAE
jgi:hypothetical protein